MNAITATGAEVSDADLALADKILAASPSMSAGALALLLASHAAGAVKAMTAEKTALNNALVQCNGGLNTMAAKIAAVGMMIGFMPDEEVHAIVEKVRAKMKEANSARALRTLVDDMLGSLGHPSERVKFHQRLSQITKGGV